MKFNKIYNSVLKSLIVEKKDPAGMGTFWKDGDLKVTMEDVISYLDQQKIPVKDVDLNKVKEILIDQDYTGKQKDRVKKANLNYPIIVIVKDGKYKSILDGNHRIFKAVEQDLKTIKVRELDLNKAPKEYKKLFDYEISKYFDERQNIDWNSNYGKTFKIVKTPEGKQSKGTSWNPNLVSVVTPENGKAWQNWIEVDKQTLKNWKKNWSEIQKSLANYKYNQIIQSQKI